MDPKSKSCQDLNNQLAIYQAFRNTHGVAAVLRQMANEHCPIQKVDSLITARVGGIGPSLFFLLATKSRGWYRFTLNRLVSLAYLRGVPFWRAPGGTRTHVSGNYWVRLS